MKPVDYIDKKIVPPQDDISPHNVDEKSELRKSIKKRCRSWVIISFITAVIFAVIGTFFLVDHSYFVAALILCIALYWGYLGYLYYRTAHAPTAREMQHHFDKLFYGVFIGEQPPIRGLIIGVIISFTIAMEYDLNWYVTLLLWGVITFLMAVLFWSWRKYEYGNYPQDDKIEQDIEKLQALEEG